MVRTRSRDRGHRRRGFLDVAGPHSFDETVERSVPTSIVGRGPDGAVVEFQFVRTTLLVVVKPRCDGCREFLLGAPTEFAGLDVVLISAVADRDGEWLNTRPVLVAPAWIESQRLMAAPSYALINGATGRLIAEGVVFSASQVRAEIDSRLI